jgi:pimeloyl-ACP methyl ester carboxylesterase
MNGTSAGTTLGDAEQRRASVNGTQLHYVSAGSDGSPVLLVHGFPESWWAFHKLIPLLSKSHRVFAVDLRGFGDSAPADDGYDSATAARDLEGLITELEIGPVHLTGQDISGPTTFRLAASRPDLVKSYTAIETGLPGFGLEMLADVTHGGAWHIGVLTAPGIPEMLLRGRERALLADYMFPSLTASPDSVTADDIGEFVRVYAGPSGFSGSVGLFRSLLSEGDEIRALAAKKLQMPVLAIGGGSGDFTAGTFRQIADNVSALVIDGVGHCVAMEAPDRLAAELAAFYREVDQDLAPK